MCLLRRSCPTAAPSSRPSHAPPSSAPSPAPSPSIFEGLLNPRTQSLFNVSIPNALDNAVQPATYAKSTVEIGVYSTTHYAGLRDPVTGAELTTKIFAYGLDQNSASWPGPTLIVPSNRTTYVKWTNNLYNVTDYPFTSLNNQSVLDTSMHWAYSVTGCSPDPRALVYFTVIARYPIIYDANVDDTTAKGNGAYLQYFSMPQHNGAIGKGVQAVFPGNIDNYYNRSGSVSVGQEYYTELGGRKDIVTTLPGEVTVIRMFFGRPGRYVWHCHILSHEDHEMMRPFDVVPW